MAKSETGDISEPPLRAASCVTTIGWPFFLGLMALRLPLTGLLVGDNWFGRKNSRVVTPRCASTATCKRAAATRASRRRTVRRIAPRFAQDSTRPGTAPARLALLRRARYVRSAAGHHDRGAAQRPRGSASARQARHVARAACTAQRRVRGAACTGEPVRCSHRARRPDSAPSQLAEPARRAAPDGAPGHRPHRVRARRHAGARTCAPDPPRRAAPSARHRHPNRSFSSGLAHQGKGPRCVRTY